MTGLTAAQETRFLERWCEYGHRFDGVNFPTPEGVCPFCTWPEISTERDRYYAFVAARTAPPQDRLHPAVGLLAQSASPLLTASER